MPSKIKEYPTFKTTRLPKVEKKNRFNSGNGRKKCDIVAKVIHEVVGFAPYEKRLIELYKTGQAAAAKRAMKFARKRLGSCKGAKRVCEKMEDVVSQQKRL